MINDWRKRASCVGEPTSVFFPENVQSDKRWDTPRGICEKCPVRSDCLKFVLQWEDQEDRWGMFAGLTPNERNLIRNERRKFGNGLYTPEDY